jgi:CTP:molybdopterin cytidylyltransferase MocA
VVGADAVAIARALAGQRVGFVTNPEPDGDMLGSVRCGLRNLPAGCRAVLLVLGDQPVISAALVTRLLSVYGTCGRGIVVPACGGRPGHPLLFSTRYCAEILAGYETTGLRGLLEIHRDDVFALEVSDPAVLTDLDTPADYCRALRATATRRGASGP